MCSSATPPAPSAHTEGLSNYHNAFASIYEGRYLAGVAAGMKLNDMIANGYITEDQAKMGYVGAFTYAEVISGYTSFYLGAKSVCPSVTMDVTFTGSWYDETAEKEGANKLIANGCVLISQHADSMGAPTACETAGVPNVSYNGSTQAACPNTFIVSSRIDWAPYYEYAITAAMNGEAIDADWTGTLATGSVVLTDVNTTAAAEGTQEAIDAVKAELENGTRHVFDCSTFTVKGETLTSSRLTWTPIPTTPPTPRPSWTATSLSPLSVPLPISICRSTASTCWIPTSAANRFSIPNSRTASGSPAFLFHGSGFPGFFPVRPVL
ncbi:MAG: BMP family ABC transporter substrate-binding protein [Dysosmobacter sp.]